MTTINITDAANNKILYLLERQSRDDMRLRLAVQPGGCSGLIQQMYFDGRVLAEDILIDVGDFEIIMDKWSAPYLEGAQLDHVDRIDKQGFVLNILHAQSTCACGDSFS